MVLTLATPVKKFFEKLEVEEVIVPADKGELHILIGHSPILTTLTEGVLSYRTNGETKKVAISWGYCEISGEEIQVLAEIAVGPEDIVKADVEAEIKASEKLIADGMDPVDLEKELSKVKQGHAKLNTIQ